MAEFFQLAKDFQSLGVVGVMGLLGYFIVRYLMAEVERLQKAHADVVSELRVAQESRFKDQVSWAEVFRAASVRDETTAQALTKAMNDQAAAFVKLADKIH